MSQEIATIFGKTMFALESFMLCKFNIILGLRRISVHIEPKRVTDMHMYFRLLYHCQHIRNYFMKFSITLSLGKAYSVEISFVPNRNFLQDMKAIFFI